MKLNSRALAYLISLVVPALTLTEIYLHATNTIARNGNWIATKASIEQSVAHGRLFRDFRVSLRQDHLDLGAWHGLNEVIFHEALPIQEIRFEALIKPNSYLVTEFNRDGTGFSGIRLSRSALYPSAWIRATPQGEFVSKVLINLPELGGDWHHYDIIQREGKAALLIDGKQVFETASERLPIQLFGFRNGQNSVLISNVQVLSPENKVVAKDSFVNTQDFGKLLLISLAIFFFLDVAVSIKQKGERWFLPAILCNGVLSVMLLSYFAADWYHFSSISHYPYTAPPWTSYLIKRSELHDQEPEGPPPEKPKVEKHPGVYRIAFIGSSQTFGEGAGKKDEVWVNLIQKKLNANRSGGLRYECLNAGEPGFHSFEVLDAYKEKWLTKGANLAVIDLSNNDTVPTTFRKSLVEFIYLNRKNGTKTVFILEPNNPEKNSEILKNNHEIMRIIAKAEKIPVIDMHSYLSSPKVYDRGFFWWDYVHMTSFGQKVFADHLFPVLKKIIP